MPHRRLVPLHHLIKLTSGRSANVHFTNNPKLLLHFPDGGYNQEKADKIQVNETKERTILMA